MIFAIDIWPDFASSTWDLVANNWNLWYLLLGTAIGFFILNGIFSVLPRIVKYLARKR
jgi:hypothetical protein